MTFNPLNSETNYKLIQGVLEETYGVSHATEAAYKLHCETLGHTALHSEITDQPIEGVA